MRAWRFSYNARGIVEVPNRLRAKETAVIVVHPWGIDDGQGWRSPEPAGVALMCTPEKNKIYNQHLEKVVNPFLVALRGKVGLVAGVSADLTKRGISAGGLIGKLAPLVGGKGGGKPDLAQAGGSDAAKLPEAIAAVQTLVREALAGAGAGGAKG